MNTNILQSVIYKNFKNDSKEINIGIHQPGYHRYIGFFYKMIHCDVFISLDNVQYVQREWQNRQTFYFSNGKSKWLSIPINKGRECIKDKIIVDPNAVKNHWLVIREIYKKTPYFKLYFDELDFLYNKKWIFLNDLCDALICIAIKILDIKATYIRASSFVKENIGTKVELLSNCIQNLLLVDNYKKVNYIPTITPISTHHYLNTENELGSTQVDKFKDYKINIKTLNYKVIPYKQYQFKNINKFFPNLSVFDLIFNLGPYAKSFLIQNELNNKRINN